MDNVYAFVAAALAIGAGLYYLLHPNVSGRLRQPPPPPASNCHLIPRDDDRPFA